MLSAASFALGTSPQGETADRRMGNTASDHGLWATQFDEPMTRQLFRTQRKARWGRGTGKEDKRRRWEREEELVPVGTCAPVPEGFVGADKGWMWCEQPKRDISDGIPHGGSAAPWTHRPPRREVCVLHDGDEKRVTAWEYRFTRDKESGWRYQIDDPGLGKLGALSGDWQLVYYFELTPEVDPIPPEALAP
ncbi:unnamed protein product [Vitrella brassicaformis CCMP3155]|uniref:Uncharacterized protein n=1 Tax=Vitrella brassicaformis (strain CCMP3155) TaxID=1169540 RepID=A0A0G4GTG2_VITBC|nr:unnamed protein product [Vitrella brassicaformis CCMP3155]|eukprot:CEM33780.1 unnamed protein product [Vitrella brassicaformis CCMP3155]